MQVTLIPPWRTCQQLSTFGDRLWWVGEWAAVMKMPFGKHKGEWVEDVPIEYLSWFLSNCAGVSPSLKKAVREAMGPGIELGTTDVSRVVGLVATHVIPAWYRELVEEFDDSQESLHVIGRAKDLLLEKLIKRN